MAPNRRNHHPEAFKTVHFARKANAIDFLEQNETKAKIVDLVLDHKELILSSLPREYFRRYNRALTYTGKLHEDLDKHLPNTFIMTKGSTGPLTIKAQPLDSTKISAEKPQWINPYGPLPLPETYELYSRVNKHYEEVIDLDRVERPREVIDLDRVERPREVIDLDRGERPRYVSGNDVWRKSSAEKLRIPLNDSQNPYSHGEARIINKKYNKHYRYHKKFEEGIHMEDNEGFGESSEWTNSYSLPPQYNLQHSDNYGPQHAARSYPPPPLHHSEPYDTNYDDHYPSPYPQYHNPYPYGHSLQHDRKNGGSSPCNPSPVLQQSQVPEYHSSEPQIKIENLEEHHTSTNHSPKKKSSSPSVSNDNEQNGQPSECQFIQIPKEDEEIVEATMEREGREATTERGVTTEQGVTEEREATPDIESDKACIESGFKKYMELLSGKLQRPVFIREGDAPNLSELQRVVLELLFL